MGILNISIKACNGNDLQRIGKESNLDSDADIVAYLIDYYFLNDWPVCPACGHDNRDDYATDIPLSFCSM